MINVLSNSWFIKLTEQKTQFLYQNISMIYKTNKMCGLINEWHSKITDQAVEKKYSKFTASTNQKKET